MNQPSSRKRRPRQQMNQPSPKRRRRHNNMEMVSAIPPDILFLEILALLPIKCLVRFQSVCKTWRAAIRSTRFARRHLELSGAAAAGSASTTAILPQEYVPNPHFSKVGIRRVDVYSFQPGQSKPGQSSVAHRILSKKFSSACGIPSFTDPVHCDGLILIPCIRQRIFVCNPTTKEFVELPRGSRNVSKAQRVALGFDPWSATYKVARHFVRSISGDVADVSGYSVGHEILTLGDSAEAEAWTWKATTDPPYPIKAKTPVCSRGFIYWTAFRSVARTGPGAFSTSDVLLRFSMRDGTFTVQPNPPGTDFLSAYDRLSELDGKLCYAQSPSPFEVAIWSATGEDGPNLAWSLRCRVKLPVQRRLPVLACPWVERGKILLTADSRWYLFKCDARDGSLETVTNLAHAVSYRHGDRVKSRTGHHYYDMVPLVESLVRIRPW